jgi:hypothetical protein
MGLGACAAYGRGDFPEELLRRAQIRLAEVVSKVRLPLLLCAVAALSFLTSNVTAERAQDRNLIVSLNGGISPLKLPRDHSVPVAVHLEGGVDTADHSPLPRVNRLTLELGWRGELLTKGLPVCPPARLKGIDTDEALAACGGSLVGRGRLRAKIFLPGQIPFNVSAYLLAFNGRTNVGRRAVQIHVYTRDPPISFIIPFVIHHREGAFHTVLVSTLRRSVGTWPHVASFRVNIARSFMHNGKRRSYLNASCPLPSSFTSAFLSFARASYYFAGGRKLTVNAVRSCRAR